MKKIAITVSILSVIAMVGFIIKIFNLPPALTAFIVALLGLIIFIEIQIHRTDEDIKELYKDIPRF